MVGIPASPYRIQNPPRPENPRKLLKNYNLAHPGPVLKITENLQFFTNKFGKKYHFLVIFRNFRDRPVAGQIVIFGDFRGGAGFVFCKGKPGSLLYGPVPV